MQASSLVNDERPLAAASRLEPPLASPERETKCHNAQRAIPVSFIIRVPTLSTLSSSDSGVTVGQISYSDVFSISHDRGYEEDIHAGDVVRMGPNLFPHFEIIAICGDKAWVRNTQNGQDNI